LHTNIELTLVETWRNRNRCCGCSGNVICYSNR